MPEAMPDGAPWPRVGIVTPSYNQAQFIEETLRSVLLQGYPNLEYIIIDGGSTDGSVDIIRKYEPWLAWWVSEPDRGQSDALNKGFGRATGQIVAWLNSDDVYEPDAIRTSVEYMTRHPDTALVYGDCRISDESGVSPSLWLAAEFTMESQVLANQIPQPTAFMCRSVLSEVGWMDATLHYAMDYDLWLKIARNHRVECVPGVRARFRVSAGAKTVTQAAKFAPEVAGILERFLSSELALPPSLKDKALRMGNLRAGLALILSGDQIRARRYLAKAFANDGHPCDQICELQEYLCCYYQKEHKALRTTLDRDEFVELVLAALPAGSVRRVLAVNLYTERAFARYQKGDRAGVRRWAMRALVGSASARRNRGLVYITFESFSRLPLISFRRRMKRQVRP